MEMPKYHLRITSGTEVAIFRIDLNDQRRVQWERCAQMGLGDGAVTMLDGSAVPEDLKTHSEEALILIKTSKETAPETYDALVAMGRLAESTHSLNNRMEKNLFDLLIWTEADLKNGLVANIGLELLEESDQEKYILQGQHFMSEGNFAKAEAEFRQALKLSGNVANLYSFLSLALAKQGKKDAAAEAINKCISTGARKSGNLVRGAVLNLEAGNTDSAKEHILKLSKNANYADAQALQISRLAMRVGLDEIGRNIARSLVESGNGGEPALEHLLNITMEHAGEKPVFEFVRTYIKAMPELPRLKEWYLRTLIADGELETAKEEAKAWAGRDPNSVKANFLLGRVHLANNEPKRALHVLHKVIALEPKNAPCYKLIADACLTLNDLESAIEASEKACKLAPKNKNFQAQSEKINALKAAAKT